MMMMEEEEEGGAMETKGICVKVAERLSEGRIACPDVSLQHSALAAKEVVARKINVAPVLIDLVFCGKRLQDSQSLESCGVRPGATVHVLRRAWPEPTARPEPVDKVEAQRALRFLHSAIASSLTHREAIFKTLNSKESLDQLVVATPGLSNDPIALGVLQDKDLFMLFADPSLLDKLIASHPALVNAMVLLLHSIVGSTPLTGSGASARQRTTSASYDIPGGFAFDGLSDDEEGEQSQSGALDQQMVGTSRPSSLRYAGSSGPRPITQTELATALALASTPGSSANTPTSGLQASTATFTRIWSCSAFHVYRCHSSRNLYPCSAACSQSQQSSLCTANPVEGAAAAAPRHGHPRRWAEPTRAASHGRGHPGRTGAHLCRNGSVECGSLYAASEAALQVHIDSQYPVTV
ncbi:ubiquitin-like protein 7 isoform X1 [Lethenteron reissneri]|uniref:ubiquitin-like protein 7 isoform X1 n=1 Tax=Lethenteron reissneri TaxID=7753 RepID=UPI002AB7BA0B|nr:ubiquitin-like protein 7 isoform X1 [Lethenteron reissneri]